MPRHARGFDTEVAYAHLARRDRKLAAWMKKIGPIAADPRWQVALHHVVEFHLDRGEPARLRPLIERLTAVDPEAGAVLDCDLLVAERRYGDAAARARAGLDLDPSSPRLWIRRAEALALAGDYEGGERAAEEAFRLWPIDPREWGGLAHRADALAAAHASIRSPLAEAA